MSFKDRAMISLLNLLAKLPPAFNRGLGAFIGDCLWFSHSRSRKVTEKNLLLCLPELQPAQRKELGRRSLREFGKSITEMGAVWLWPVDRVLELIHAANGLDLLEENEHQHGTIVLSPHLGNWEILGLFLAQQRKPLTVLYQPPRSAALGELIQRARTRNGVRLAPTDRRGVMAVFKALRRGEYVGILPDQVPERESGVFAPFFGVPALTMTLVNSLLHKTGARAICGYAKRLPAGGFEIFFEPVEAALYGEDMASSTAALNRSVENAVRKLPDQYQWEYKRFKKRPAGEQRVYEFS